MDSQVRVRALKRTLKSRKSYCVLARFDDGRREETSLGMNAECFKRIKKVV
jgi:hypothetical protein